MNFPFPVDVNTQSAVTHVRSRGEMTREVAEYLLRVVASWAACKITLKCGNKQEVEAGTGAVNVVCVCNDENFTEFYIKTPEGLVSPVTQRPSDPKWSDCALLRAITGAASLLQFEFPRTVFPEGYNERLDLPLPAAAKPDALTIAQSIWRDAVQKVPQVKLADHTELDSMGSLNLGSMFKVTSVLAAQGALCKYILCVINQFQLLFLSDDNIVYVGSGIGRTAWLLSALAQLDLNVYAFERYVPNHDVSAHTLREVRRHTKVHKLKVASSV